MSGLWPAPSIAVACRAEWTPKALDRMIRREVYKLAQPGRIIDGRVWNGAQAALAARRKVKAS